MNGLQEINKRLEKKVPQELYFLSFFALISGSEAFKISNIF